MSTSSLRIRALLCALALTCAACANIPNLLPKLPTLKQSDLDRIELAESSKIYAAGNELITTLHGPENRTVIPIKRIPETVQNAVVAIEDERFWEHKGVDWQAVVRALLANVRSGEIQEGGSTITQQYVKNAIIAPGAIAERTLDRKLKEAAYAAQLETKISKEEILERYLNTVYFGQGAYGIQAAAKTFFGKTARNLNLAQAATLAGLIRSPGRYDPFNNKRAALERRNLVLAKMEELGYITPEKSIRAQNKKLKVQPAAAKDTYPAPYFIDYVQRLITYDPRFDMLGKNPQQRTETLFQGGLRIETTVDLEMQAAAEQAIDQALLDQGDPHASLVAVEPETGHVKALVGGRDWFAPRKEDPYAKLNLAILAEPDLGCVAVPKQKRCDNRAPGTGRQAGSAFKSFTLAAALEQGVSLAQSYEARGTMTFPGANAGSDWVVHNYESTEFGSNLPLLEATVNSVNVVYAQLILEIGPAAAVEVAHEMGINTDIPVEPASVLGAGPVNPLGMASAYGTLANNGTHHPPVAITRIVGGDGKVLYEDETEEEEVLEPAVSYLTTSALEQVIQRGTAARYGQIGRPAAGKTGTAQEYRDAWFAGYTPNLSAAVWVGYPEGEIEMKPACSVRFRIVDGVEQEICRPTRTISGGGVTGGSFPTMIWQAFMLRALSGVPAESFIKPSTGIVTVAIDTRKAGCLASRFTPDEFRATGTFAKGTEPTETCRIKGDSKEVPNVFSFPVDDAIRVLEDAGFDVVQEEEPTTTYPPGIVVDQDPAGGARAPKGATVTIFVSVRGNGNDDGGDDDDDDERTVPNVLGYNRSAAEAALRNAGFAVRVVTEAESSPGQAKKRKNRVWKQSPAGGSEAERGSVVTIWVNPD